MEKNQIKPFDKLNKSLIARLAGRSRQTIYNFKKEINEIAYLTLKKKKNINEALEYITNNYLKEFKVKLTKILKLKSQISKITQRTCNIIKTIYLKYNTEKIRKQMDTDITPAINLVKKAITSPLIA